MSLGRERLPGIGHYPTRVGGGWVCLIEALAGQRPCCLYPDPCPYVAWGDGHASRTDRFENESILIMTPEALMRTAQRLGARDAKYSTSGEPISVCFICCRWNGIWFGGCLRLDADWLYSQVPAFSASDRAVIDVLTTHAREKISGGGTQGG